MSNIVNRGKYHQMPNVDKTGWTRGERCLYDALYKKAHGVSRDILELTTVEIMSLADIHSRVTFKAAVDGLTRRGYIRAESIRGSKRTGQPHYFWKFVLCDPSTGIAYADSAEEDRLDKTAYRKSYDPLGWIEEPTLPVTRAKELGARWDLTPDEMKKYYSNKIPSIVFSSASEWTPAKCPFPSHDDTRPSFSVHLGTGNYRCHGCDEKGNWAKLEMKLSNVDFEQAKKNVYDIVGRKKLSPKREAKKIKNECGLYPYEDEQGNPLFQIMRYTRPDREHMQYKVCRRSADGRATLIGLGGARKVLYRLPEVIAASTVISVEGEKDADRLASLGLIADDDSLVAVTCNPFGAGNWQAEYSQFLKGKKIIALGDNDKKGIAHIEAICTSVRPLASELRKTTLYPSSPLEGQDVSNYLEEHSVDDLLSLMGTDWIKPAGIPTTIPIIAEFPDKLSFQ